MIAMACRLGAASGSVPRLQVARQASGREQGATFVTCLTDGSGPTVSRLCHPDTRPHLRGEPAGGLKATEAVAGVRTFVLPYRHACGFGPSQAVAMRRADH